MKNILSILGYIASFSLATATTVRYYWIWYDPSTLMQFILLALILFILSYVYGWMKLKDDKIDNMQRQMDAIGAELFNETKEARKELALGIR